MFCDVYVLELLRFETIMFSDATLSDINVVLCYLLSQYIPFVLFYLKTPQPVGDNGIFLS